MNNFPLYNTLSVNLPTKDLTIKQKSDLVKHLSSFDPEECKLAYALIRSYYLDKDKGDVLSLPYNPQLSKNKKKQSIIKFDLLDFPIPLRQLLYKFVTLHQKRIMEDNEIKNLQL